MIRVLFYFMTFIVIGSALFVAGTKNLVRSVFMFFVTLMGLAGLYVLALADFVAITQIVIYVGGILILILFAFMLSGRETLGRLQDSENSFFSWSKLIFAVIALLFFIVLWNMMINTHADDLPWIKNSIAVNNQVTSGAGMTENIGVNLMTRYLLPFEVISILLMMALVGAAHLSRKGEGDQ